MVWKLVYLGNYGKIKDKLWVMSYKFKFTIYVFKSTSYQFKSMKARVTGLKERVGRLKAQVRRAQVIRTSSSDKAKSFIVYVRVKKYWISRATKSSIFIAYLMLNLSLTQRFWKIFSTALIWKNISDQYITIIFSQLGNLESLTQVRLKVYYNNAINAS